MEELSRTRRREGSYRGDQTASLGSDFLVPDLLQGDWGCSFSLAGPQFPHLQ